MMAMIVSNSLVTTRKVQKYFLEEYQREFPEASEKELWLMVLSSRIDALKNNILAGNIASGELEAKINKILKIIENYEEIINKLDSFEELCDYIESLDEEIIGMAYSSQQEPYGFAEMIDEILK